MDKYKLVKRLEQVQLLLVVEIKSFPDSDLTQIVTALSKLNGVIADIKMGTEKP